VHPALSSELTGSEICSFHLKSLPTDRISRPFPCLLVKTIVIHDSRSVSIAYDTSLLNKNVFDFVISKAHTLRSMTLDRTHPWLKNRITRIKIYRLLL
jgi:hypothetical protein